MNQLLELIRDVCNRIIDARLKNQPRFWVAQVVAGSPSVPQNSTCQVFVNGDTTSTPITLKNKSNETLTAGNQVYIFSTSGSLTDSIILIKK